MAHSFSRFRGPTARERFQKASRPAGNLALLFPTILATLFLFMVVVALNQQGSMSRGGKIIRLLSVEDVFPTQNLEEKTKKDFWEQPAPPTPSAAPVDSRDMPVFVEPRPLPVFTPVSRPNPAPSRSSSVYNHEIEMPDIAPNTEIAPQPATPTP